MGDMVRSISEISSYHAHIYFDSADARSRAEWLREEAGARFLVRMGRWHDRLIGPHTQPMYQIAFETSILPTILPWLMLNHDGLSILIHPNTTNPRRDHVRDGIWIGRALRINDAALPEHMDSADLAGEPNTAPHIPL